MKRRILSLLVALCLIAALLPMSVLAASYPDTDGHWAESSIDRWSEAAVVQGTDGEFRPDLSITRAQIAAIFARLLRLPEASPAEYHDLTADAWYADAVSRCAAAGILTGYPDGTFRPNDPVTREQACAMLARALGIAEARRAALSGFPDAADTGDWAEGYVAAMLDRGILTGLNGKLAPKAPVTRAQFVTILDRAIAVYADEDGATVKAADLDADGVIVVVAEDVTVKDAPAGATVVAAAKAKGLKVNGKSVDANEVHVVPETVERPKSAGHAHTHEYKYTDNGDGTHTGVCTANDSTLDPAEHDFDENRKCTVCGAVISESSVASVRNADGSYTYFEKLTKAISNAESGATITLVRDVDTPKVGYAVKGKTLTLDLNGKTLTGNGNNGVLRVTDGGTLTINGDGKVVATESKDYYAMAVWSKDEGSKIIINGGAFTQTITGTDSQYDMIYASGKASIEINGGSFKIGGGHEKWTLNCKDKDGSSIIVSGGTFYKRNPAEDSTAPAGYTEVTVADGCFVQANEDDTYTVVTADQITSGVTIQGIAGYEHIAFATVQDAYDEINPKVAALGGLGRDTCSEEAFNAFYTDHARITWTIYGEQTLVANDEGKDAHTFTFGRAASYYRDTCNIAAVIVKGGNDSAALDLSATGNTFTLPYNWWGENIKNCEISFTGITFDHIKSIPYAWASTQQKTPYTFDRCTFNGGVYGYHDYNINLTIQNSTFNATDEKPDYAVMLQSTTGINGTVTLDGNTFNGYTRGVNLQRPGTDFIFTNNTITSTVSEPDRAAIQLTDGKSFVVSGNTVRVNAGNAFWFHYAATNSDVTYTISNNDIQAPYLGYSAASFDVNPKITSSGNIFNSTDTTHCMRKDATEATPTNLTAIR